MCAARGLDKRALLPEAEAKFVCEEAEKSSPLKLRRPVSDLLEFEVDCERGDDERRVMGVARALRATDARKGKKPVVSAADREERARPK